MRPANARCLLLSVLALTVSACAHQDRTTALEAPPQRRSHFRVLSPDESLAAAEPRPRADSSTAEPPEARSRSSVPSRVAALGAATDEAAKKTPGSQAETIVRTSGNSELSTALAQPLEAPAPTPAGGTNVFDHGGPDGDRDDAAGPLLGLADLEAMALESNPTLAQLAAAVDKARGIRTQVGLHPNPTIGYFGEEMGDDGTAGIQGGFINQTIVTGDKLRLNRAVAGWDVEGLNWEYQAQRYRVLNDLRLRFYEVLGAQRRIRIATDLVDVAEQGVAAAEQLYEAKQGARPDVLQARVDLNEVRIILQNARVEYDAAWSRLTSVIGRPELTPAPLHGDLEGGDKVREWETTYQRLLDASPELQAALTRVQRARTQIRRQEVQPIPNLLTGVGVAHDNAGGNDIANVQVGLPIPIFNRNQGNIAIAQAEYHRALRDVERLRLDLRNRLALAFRDLRQAEQQVERYRTDILPTAKENLDLTEVGYKQGEFDFLRVLTARRTYFEANLRYVTSLLALRQADVVLDGLLLTGGLADVPDVSPGVGGVGQRGQALSQQ